MGWRRKIATNVVLSVEVEGIRGRMGISKCIQIYIVPSGLRSDVRFSPYDYPRSSVHQLP